MIEVFKMLSQHGHALTVLQGQVWVSPFGLMDLLQGKGTNVDLGPVVAEGTWIRLCCLPANITRSGKKRKRRQQPVLGSVTFHTEHSPKMWHSKNKSKGKGFFSAPWRAIMPESHRPTIRFYHPNYAYNCKKKLKRKIWVILHISNHLIIL